MAVKDPALQGELLARGAEAELRLVIWMGRKALAKRRIPKSYRLPELDRMLRQGRTKVEARLLRDARTAGVLTPLVYDVDLAQDACTITMEYIHGEQVKRLLNSGSKPETLRLCRMIGESVGRLHAGGIVHGDLTTSNMLFCEGRMYFIDFGLGGLSEEIEVQGVDLRVLKEAFTSTHAQLKGALEQITKSYESTFKKGGEAVARMKEIAARGRYTD